MKALTQENNEIKIASDSKTLALNSLKSFSTIQRIQNLKMKPYLCVFVFFQ